MSYFAYSVCPFQRSHDIKAALTCLQSHNEAPRVYLGVQCDQPQTLITIPDEMHTWSRGSNFPDSTMLYHFRDLLWLVVRNEDPVIRDCQYYFTMHELDWHAIDLKILIQDGRLMLAGSMHTILRLCETLVLPDCIHYIPNTRRHSCFI